MSIEHCIVCGKRKQIPKHVAKPATSKRSKARAASTYVDRSVYENDPYCSRTCCEEDIQRKAVA